MITIKSCSVIEYEPQEELVRGGDDPTFRCRPKATYGATLELRMDIAGVERLREILRREFGSEKEVTIEKDDPGPEPSLFSGATMPRLPR